MCRSRAAFVALVFAWMAGSAHAEESAPASEDARLAAIEAANAARSALEAGKLDGIDALLERAIASNEALATPAARATLLMNVARSYARLASLRAASRGDRRRAAQLLEQAAALAASDADARMSSYAHGYLGALYEDSGRLGEARTLTRRALFEAGRARSADALYRWQWQLGRIERAAGNPEAALASYRKAAATLAALCAELAAQPGDAAFAFRSEMEPVYLELVDLLLRRAAAPGEPAARQSWLGEARDAYEALKAAELRDYFGDECLDAQRKVTPEQVPGAAVLYPILLPDRVELLVSSAAGIAVQRAPVDRATLESEVRSFRQLVTKRTTRQYQPAAGRLYDWLIRPVLPSLAGRGIATLVVVPTGVLRTIPFTALRDEQTGQFLIEQLAVAIAPGLTLTDPRPIRRDQVALLALGVTEAVQGYPALPRVADEIATVQATFPGVKLLDRDFSVERLEAEMAKQPFDIVHVASHGEFVSEASQSFLLTHDGTLSMDRLAALVGRTRFRAERPLELLALTACQTAAGDERAALGLAGVALRAGARSALATLWSVNDESAMQLVTRFYRELGEGTSRAQALQRAQLELLRGRVFEHPGYWSAFLLISSWL